MENKLLNIKTNITVVNTVYHWPRSGPQPSQIKNKSEHNVEVRSVRTHTIHKSSKNTKIAMPTTTTTTPAQAPQCVCGERERERIRIHVLVHYCPSAALTRARTHAGMFA